MQQTLWGNQIPKRRRKTRDIPLQSATPYSITENDCAVFGHSIREWDLAGCTVCLDCRVNIFCPRCIAAHPLDEKAIPILCTHHEES